MVMGETTVETQVAVVGGGVGGYSAAFRAADLGLDVAMIDTKERPGGVCLYEGCIPTKALLHAAYLIPEARESSSFGVILSEPQVDLDRMRAWKNEIVDRLTKGVMTLSRRREIQYIQGRAEFEGSDGLRLSNSDVAHVRFEHAILATGSLPIPLPGTEFEPDSRVMDAGAALALTEIPETLLVVGGGYIGMELGSVYAWLGSRVTVVEMMDSLLPGTDRDLVRHFSRSIAGLFENIYLNTRVTSLQEHPRGVKVRLEGEAKQLEHEFDRALVAIGRRPNSRNIGLENTRVEVDERGFVVVDARMRTADERILAVGDVVREPMLAHKAMYEGKVAAEVLAGHAAAFDARSIPAVVYTQPQVAWCGLMEAEANKQGRPIRVTKFPWGASGRALTLGAPEGLTKLVLDADTGRVLGMGIVGAEAENMISEAALAIEMGALAEDLAWTIHPHPTLSETESEAAEAFLGSATHTLVASR